MTRASLCATILALVAAQCAAARAPLDRTPVHRFGDGATPKHKLDDSETQSSQPDAPLRQRQQITPQDTLRNTVADISNQIALQQAVLDAILNETEKFFNRYMVPLTWDSVEALGVDSLKEMVEKIRQRLENTTDGINTIQTLSHTMDQDSLRSFTNDLIKELKVEEALLEALWSSLRQTQAKPWTSLRNAQDQKEASITLNRAAEEYLGSVYGHMMLSGFAEDDIVKFVPKVYGQGLFDRQARLLGPAGHWASLDYTVPYGWSYPLGYSSTCSASYTLPYLARGSGSHGWNLLRKPFLAPRERQSGVGGYNAGQDCALPLAPYVSRLPFRDAFQMARFVESPPAPLFDAAFDQTLVSPEAAYFSFPWSTADDFTGFYSTPILESPTQPRIFRSLNDQSFLPYGHVSDMTAAFNRQFPLSFGPLDAWGTLGSYESRGCRSQNGCGTTGVFGRNSPIGGVDPFISATRTRY